MDSFLTPHFDIESGTILTAFINDNWLKFVVEIDKETRLETEASSIKRLGASKAKKAAHSKAKQDSMTPEEREAANAKYAARGSLCKVCGTYAS